jgi:hypothetical protein
MTELEKIVRGFRRGLLDGEQPAMMCFAVCAPLQTLLAMYGYKSELIEGDFGEVNHFWQRLADGTIIDPTASQFRKPTGGKMPAVYIGPKPEWYKENEQTTSNRKSARRNGRNLATPKRSRPVA